MCCATSPIKASSPRTAASSTKPNHCRRPSSPTSPAATRTANCSPPPAEWLEDIDGPAPVIRIDVPRRPKPGTVAGVGDRALLRVEKSEHKGERGSYRGRVIKVLDKTRHRILGIFRTMPNGDGRLIPIDKKQAGRELSIPAAHSAGAQDGDLISVELMRSRGFGLPQGRVKERLGSLKTEKAISLIAIHAHDIPQEFPADVIRESEAAQPATLAGREDWRDVPLVTIDPPDAKDHDDAVHAEPDSDPNNKGGYIVNVAIADVAFYVRPNSPLDREALNRGNSVYFPDRVVPMLPERISNDLCLAETRRTTRCAGGAHDHRTRWAKALAYVSSRADALGSQVELRAGASRHRWPS